MIVWTIVLLINLFLLHTVIARVVIYNKGCYEPENGKSALLFLLFIAIVWYLFDTFPY